MRLRRRRKQNPRAYRLSFGHTRTKKWAPTLKQAVEDAKYWTNWGQLRVCIDRSLPSGEFRRIRCIKAKRRSG